MPVAMTGSGDTTMTTETTKTTETTFEIKLMELGNGWPDVGDYLRDYDDFGDYRLLRVVEFVGPIHTGTRTGDPDYQYTIVELAPDDIDEDGLTIFGDD